MELHSCLKLLKSHQWAVGWHHTGSSGTLGCFSSVLLLEIQICHLLRLERNIQWICLKKGKLDKSSVPVWPGKNIAGFLLCHFDFLHFMMLLNVFLLDLSSLVIQRLHIDNITVVYLAIRHRYQNGHSPIEKWPWSWFDFFWCFDWNAPWAPIWQSDLWNP